MSKVSLIQVVLETTFQPSQLEIIDGRRENYLTASYALLTRGRRQLPRSHTPEGHTWNLVDWFHGLTGLLRETASMVRK